MTYPDGEDKHSLWNERDGMYYDAIQWGGHSMRLPVRSLVGLIPLYATLTLEPSVVNQLPRFKKRMNWFLENGPEVSGRNMANMFLVVVESASCSHSSKDRLISILEKMLDESEFFSDTAFDPIEVTQGLAWKLTVKDTKSVIGPGSPSLECLVVIPTGAAQFRAIRDSIDTTAMNFRWPKRSSTGSSIFFGRDINGRRALNGGNQKLNFDPFRDYVWFYEVRYPVPP
ncbi:hypothetical protein EDB85DRAFT_2286250 [Lactarius pseudohatsudake]|nr:hypothetical protein EDB85DRAFT_2286250 [Lactarius pseudohatsudake]